MTPTLQETRPGRELKRRFLYLGLAMVAGLLLVAGRLYRLQVSQGEEYSAKSVANFVKEVRLRADRGLIKDRRGVILVDSRPSFDAFITPAFCQHCSEAVLPRLAELLGWDKEQRAKVEELVRLARRSAPFQPVPVKIDVSRDEYDRVSARLEELPGVDVVPVQHRHYRTGTVLSHVLGYMNEINPEELERLGAEGSSYALGDYIGRRGLERYFEPQLRGKDGVRKEVVDARGQTIDELNGRLGPDAVQQPVPGGNVVLSLDMRLQEAAEQAFPGAAGAVVVVDVKTGFVRALVSRPGFDPNLLTGRITPTQMAALNRDPMQPMVNRITAEHYAPGSIFKVVTTLAAYKSGQFSPASTTFCSGGYRLGRRVWRCHKDSGHGHRNGKEALQSSCDVWYYKVADVLGLDPIAEMGRALGLGSPTGIGVLAEVPGIMPSTAYHDKASPGGYTKGMALNSAIGQGDDNVTPLQMAMVYAAIANGGTLHKPQLVERIEDHEGRVVQKFEPQEVRKVAIAPEHRRAVIDALISVVNEAGGTAYSKRLKDLVVAGKTGTAQVVRLVGARLKTHQMDFFQRDHAWFASFAPADTPEIAVVVLNEHGGHGGSDAAPTAMAVIQKYFELKAQDAGKPLPRPQPYAPPVARAPSEQHASTPAGPSDDDAVAD